MFFLTLILSPTTSCETRDKEIGPNMSIMDKSHGRFVQSLIFFEFVREK